MNRNVSNSDSSELLFPPSRSRSDEIGLGSSPDDVSEKRSSANETISYPVGVKNVKMKSYFDSREVCSRAKCRCSSPQRWNEQRHVCKSDSSSCCIISVKNKSEVPSEDCEIGRLSNDLASNVKLCTDSPVSPTCVANSACHLHSTKACKNASSLNGILKLEHTGVHTDSEFSASVCNGVESEHDTSCSPLESAALPQKSPTEECCDITRKIEYISYGSECQMPDIMRLIQKDLSEPYSIYTYRYFIHNWPHLCFLALDGEECVGAIVCKLDMNKNVVRRGYIAMLAVDEKYRKQKIGSNLVLKAIQAMIADDADEVVLETEITNKPALRLYENLGFVRDKRLFRYYLNGVDALRLKLWLR